MKHLLRAAAFLIPLALTGAASADVLFRAATQDASPPNDDGYDPAVVSITLHPDVTGPSNGSELSAGAVGLARFWNSEWAGFSLGGDNGTTLDNGSPEFERGYLTFTISANPGFVLDLTSLDFLSARGGGDPATQTRRFEIYAATNGGAINYGDTPVLQIANEFGVRATPAPMSADLSSAAFQGLDSVTFRYYTLTPASGNTMDFANMTLNGSARQVPEPATGMLLGLVAIPLLRRRPRW